MDIRNNFAFSKKYEDKIGIKQFWNILIDIYEVKQDKKIKALITYLPHELTIPKCYHNMWLARCYISFAELLKNIYGVNLYWSIQPVFDKNTHELVCGKMFFSFIPLNIDWCLDTGYTMLGAGNKTQMRKYVEVIFEIHEKVIKHINIHENNGKKDLRLDPRKQHAPVLTKKLITKLTDQRTYVFL